MWELNKLFTIYFELLGFKFHTLHSSFKKIETFQFEKSVIFLKKKKMHFFFTKNWLFLV